MLHLQNFILSLLIVGLFLFAIVHEYFNHSDSYSKNNINKYDTIFTSIKKLENCLQYEFKTILWRRCYIASFIFAIFIFFIYYNKFPNSKELLLYVFFNFFIIYYTWYTFIIRTASGAINLGKINIRFIKKKYLEILK